MAQLSTEFVGDPVDEGRNRSNHAASTARMGWENLKNVKKAGKLRHSPRAILIAAVL